MTEKNEKSRVSGENRRSSGRHIPRRSPDGSGPDRVIRATPPPYRWVCPCQEPPVLLATYDPGGKLNIKVRDRYWHLYGFGQVHAICPKCGAEHVLDLSELHRRTGGQAPKDGDVLAG